MLLVIMTKSLIRLDSIVRASLNNDCMTNRHDDRHGRARTETDSDITGNDRDEIVITKGYKSITGSYKSITRSYKRERERVGTNTNNDDITRGYN